MGFCTNCGNQLKAEEKFCTSCGNPIQAKGNQETSSTEVDNHTHNEQAEQLQKDSNIGKKEETVGTQQKQIQQAVETQQVSLPEKKPMSKRNKILIGTVAAFIVLLFGVHKYLESHFDPMKQVVAMENALSEKKMDEFFNLIELEEDALIDKESYFEHIKDKEWESAIKNQYIHIIEADKEKATPYEKVIESEMGYPLLKLKPKSIFGLYKGYTVRAVPMKLEAQSNIDATEISILDKSFTVELADEGTDIGLIYPGTYDVQATAKGKYGDFTYDEIVQLDSYDSEMIDIEFETNFYYIYTGYDYEDAILFIDDKSTKTAIGEYTEIGPFPEDTDKTLHAEWKNTDGNTIRSNTVKLQELGDYPEIYFDFDAANAVHADVAGDVEAEVGQFILDFRNAYEDAVNYADFFEIENYLKPDSHAEKELKKFIKDMEDGYYYYEFYENIILNVEKKDKKTYHVKTNELFMFRDDDGKEYDYDREKMYIVEIIDEQFLISKIEYTDTQKSSS